MNNEGRLRDAGLVLPRNEIQGDQRKDDQRAPIQPMRQYEIEAGHRLLALLNRSEHFVIPAKKAYKESAA